MLSLYQKFIAKALTFVGCFIVYFFGISLSSICLKIFSSKPDSYHWQKIEPFRHPEAMS